MVLFTGNETHACNNIMLISTRARRLDNKFLGGIIISGGDFFYEIDYTMTLA